MVKGQGIDVSLLVLNAGLMKHQKFINIDPKDTQAMIDVNMYQPAAMLKFFLPDLLERQDKSGIILVGSL